MARSAKKPAASLLRRCTVFRVLSMVVLVVSLGIEVLSCSFVECVALAPAERSGYAFCLEPLQVCEDIDTFEVLFDLPVLTQEAPCLLASPAERRYLQNVVAFTPDGFHGTIDHPPQFRS